MEGFFPARAMGLDWGNIFYEVVRIGLDWMDGWFVYDRNEIR